MKPVIFFIFYILSSFEVTVAFHRSAYFTRERSGLPLSDVPREHIANLTHITYSFAHLDTSINCAVLPHDFLIANDKVLAGDLITLFQLKKEFRQLKTGVSISGLFGDVITSKGGLQKFSESVVNLVKNYGLDYIDLDWEFPVIGEDSATGAKGSPSDTQTFVTIAKGLHEQFQAFPGPFKPKLSIALPCPWDYIKNYDIGNLHKFLDVIHLMSYDFNTPAGGLAYHQANLFSDPDMPSTSIQNTTEYLLKVGVPLSKVIVGIPAYAYTFRNLGVGKGLGTLINQPEQETQGNSYDDRLTQSLIKAIPPTYQNNYMKWDSATQSSYLYNPKTQSITTLDTERSVKSKTDYIKANGLGGAFIWALAWENMQSAPGLLTTLKQELAANEPDEVNNLIYPNSKFQNVRSDATILRPSQLPYIVLVIRAVILFWFN